jgi:hypothetical protein
MKLVLSCGLEKYRLVSQEWNSDLEEIKKEIDSLISVNIKIVSACSAQEMLVLPESYSAQAKKLGVKLRSFMLEPNTPQYHVAKTVSIW